jgi:hypothetical protein
LISYTALTRAILRTGVRPSFAVQFRVDLTGPGRQRRPARRRREPASLELVEDPVEISVTDAETVADQVAGDVQGEFSQYPQ